jgi:YegS/Rv2252/BmrU family lipid kinase
MRYALILNPVSGSGRGLKILPKILKFAEKRNLDCELFTTTGPGDATELGRLCRFREFDRVVVIGGDGSVNETGVALAGGDIVMGILPGGSGNDFYKMLGNNGRLEKGLETAFLGKACEVDVGLINGRRFFNTVGIGFDAEVAHRAAKSTGMAGMMVYLSAVFQSWRNLKPVELKIAIDNIEIELNITLICVGNGKSSGGGFYLTPHAEFDDGVFDICLIEAMPKSRIFRYLPRTLNGSHVRLPGVRVYRSRKMMVRSYRNLTVHVDGEPLTEPTKEAEFVMDTRKLKVAVAE